MRIIQFLLAAVLSMPSFVHADDLRIPQMRKVVYAWLSVNESVQQSRVEQTHINTYLSLLSTDVEISSAKTNTAHKGSEQIRQYVEDLNHRVSNMKLKPLEVKYGDNMAIVFYQARFRAHETGSMENEDRVNTRIALLEFNAEGKIRYLRHYGVSF